MNILKLRTFVLTAESGSLSQVAKIMGKSRPSLSMSLSSLEDELGVELFHRTKNKLTLSEAGQELFPDCKNIVNIADNIYSKSLRLAGGVRNNIRVAYDDSLPLSFWRKRLTFISESDQGATFSVIKASSPDLPALVKEKQVDVAYGLMISTIDDPSLNVNVLHRIRMMVVCAANHPLAKMPKVSSVDISAHRQIILAHLSDDVNPEFKPLASNNIAFPSYHEVLDAVLDNLGWAIVPEPLVKDELRKETLKVVKHPNGMFYENFAELSRPNEPQPELAQLLAENIAESIYDIL